MTEFGDAGMKATKANCPQNYAQLEVQELSAS